MLASVTDQLGVLGGTIGGNEWRCDPTWDGQHVDDRPAAVDRQDRRKGAYNIQSPEDVDVELSSHGVGGTFGQYWAIEQNASVIDQQTYVVALRCCGCDLRVVRYVQGEGIARVLKIIEESRALA